LGPIVIEVFITLATIGGLYEKRYFWMNFASISLYAIATYFMTEQRAKYFKIRMKKDATYVQSATDSLLNFETVKYFNAEDHETRRFYVSLNEFKVANVKVAISLVALNVS